MGKPVAVQYHKVLIFSGLLSAIIFTMINFTSYFQWVYLITTPLFIINVRSVAKKSALELDPYLKQLAISTLLFVLFFGVGNLLK